MIFDFVICSSFFADMVELEDTSDLSSDGLYRAGSSPAIRLLDYTKIIQKVIANSAINEQVKISNTESDL